MNCEFEHNIFASTSGCFEEMALEMFRFQYHHNDTYRQFADALGVLSGQVQSLEQIPFLPISFFKSHQITTTAFLPEYSFESSGTTGTSNSRHYIRDLEVYKRSFLQGFRLFYGEPEEWCIIGLLPSYLERGNSSLVFMVNELITLSNHPESGFYLDEYDRLQAVLNQLENSGQKTLLVGVTFGLLDFAERFTMKLRHTIVMETGGMKGRRIELTRPEVHDILMSKLGIEQVHSEYGMTELLSQAYSTANGLFRCPGWMKVLVRDEDDPLLVSHTKVVRGSSVSGALNIIDLANLYSCAFLATDDAGRLYPDGSFEVLGRMDNSDIRGCSLMAV
jgi:phenylacetate-coenzyme A ligase PaaK-like adenylate-forming protein